MVLVFGVILKQVNKKKLKLYKEKLQEASSMESTLHTQTQYSKNLKILKIEDMVNQGRENIVIIKQKRSSNRNTKTFQKG